jgi:hypothetical protein
MDTPNQANYRISPHRFDEASNFTEVRALSDRDRDVFLGLSEADIAPNNALRSAAERFREAVKRGDILI